MWLLAGAGVSVHRLELELEPVVKQLMPIPPQKRIQLSIPLEPSPE